MKLFTIQDSKEKKLLRSKLKPFSFKDYSEKEIRDLIKEMRALMRKESGIGLAANQAGLDMRVFVAAAEGNAYAIFNPKITKTSGERILMEEGCLSIPGSSGLINRYEKVTLEGFNSSGKKIKIKAFGLLAQIFQHETDHLDGILYTDKAEKTFKNE